MKKPDHNTLGDIFDEIVEQPEWRAQADREMDYCDGNQLDSATLIAQREIGIPSATENLLGPAMIDIEGDEAKNRTDWIVQADDDDDEEGEAVAKATSYKLNQAERRSGTDRALTEAYKSLNRVGAGFIEVGREKNPFKFPYKVEFVHRNEVYWDWYAKQHDLSDARWMLRRRWSHVDAVMKKWPKKKLLIRHAGQSWGDEDDLARLYAETGSSTDLAQSLDIARGWSVEEQEWRDPHSSRVCLFQLDTMESEQKEFLEIRTGKKVLFDENNQMHRDIVVGEFGILSKEDVTFINRSIFVGPHRVQCERLEHDKYPIVGCFGKLEDRTRVPYGTLRWLMYLQDEVNARISKMQWLLGSVWTKRTKGAVLMKDEVFRQMASRPDADFILDQDHMARPGATFEIERNADLNQQQYNRLLDLRESIKRISGVSDAMSGDGGHNTSSGLSQMIEQSAQSLATLNDNFSFTRTQVGELLLGMIVRDIGKEEHDVTVKGNALKQTEVITLNSPIMDEETGQEYLRNNVQKAMLSVTLEDVPSTPAYKQQQLVSLTEIMKSSDQQLKDLLYPYYFALTNVANKEDIIKDLMEARQNGQLTPEMVEQRVKEAIEQEKTKWMVEQKDRQLDLQEEKQGAEIKKLITEAVNNRIESIYSGTQAALQVASTPGVAVVTDQVLKSGGFEDQDEAPIVAAIPGPITVPPQITQNTSPAFPPRVQDPETEMPEETEMIVPESPGEGMNEGIEAQGVQ